jgi:hypothetical protein
MGGDHLTSNSIGFRSDDTGATGSMNENLTVQPDEQTLYLKALMSGFHQGGRDRKLTMQGAAEYLWELFMEPLQRELLHR